MVLVLLGPRGGGPAGEECLRFCGGLWQQILGPCLTLASVEHLFEGDHSGEGAVRYLVAVLPYEVCHLEEVLELQVDLVSVGLLMLVFLLVSGVRDLSDVQLLLLLDRRAEALLQHLVPEDVGDVRVAAVSRKGLQAAEGLYKVELLFI